MWSTGDATGYASHADYLFGWKGDALQRNMDAKGEYMSVKSLTRQNIQAGNKCEVKDMVHEQFDGCKLTLPSCTRTSANCRRVALPPRHGTHGQEIESIFPSILQLGPHQALGFGYP